MINFKKAREIAFSELSKDRKVKRLLDSEISIPDSNKYVEIWETSIDICNLNGLIIEVELYICLPNDFPLTIPKFYLHEKSEEEYMYLPHIDSDRSICTFDSDTTSVDTNSPDKIIKECLVQCRRIIEDGINGINKNDFEDEFETYWLNRYHKKDTIRISMLSIVDYSKSNDCSNLKLLVLEKRFSQFEYVLHSSDENTEKFKKYIDNKKIGYSEETVFLLPSNSLKLSPPYDIRIKDILSILKEQSTEVQKKFECYVNSKQKNCFLIIPQDINGIQKYFALEIVSISRTRPGFRDGKLKLYDSMCLSHQNDRLVRYLPDNLSESRINFRSSGINKNNGLSFSIAGLGSIGSNLIYFLNSQSPKMFRLIDYDFLRNENIGRHLLGFSNVNIQKCEAIKDFLLNKFPLQIIETKEESIFKIIESTPEFINETDYFFVAIGKQNYEEYIAQAIEDKIISAPTFFFWVEPYLAGGHFVYIDPNDSKFKYSNFFEEGYWKYNVICNQEYLSGNPELLKKEAGCTSNFVPYSNENVVLFISSVYPFINNIISKKVNTSCSYTWLGNLDFLKSKNIRLNKEKEKLPTGFVIKNF